MTIQKFSAHCLSVSFNISVETISTSVSAAAIFCSEESWGRPPKRKDIVTSVFKWYYITAVQSVSDIAFRYIGAECSQDQYLYKLVDGVVQVT